MQRHQVEPLHNLPGVSFDKASIPGIDPSFTRFYQTIQRDYKATLPEVCRTLDNIINVASQQNTDGKPYADVAECSFQAIRQIAEVMPTLKREKPLQDFSHEFNLFSSQVLSPRIEVFQSFAELLEPHDASWGSHARDATQNLRQAAKTVSDLTDAILKPTEGKDSPDEIAALVVQRLKSSTRYFSADQKVLTGAVETAFKAVTNLSIQGYEHDQHIASLDMQLKQLERDDEPDQFAIIQKAAEIKEAKKKVDQVKLNDKILGFKNVLTIASIGIDHLARYEKIDVVTASKLNTLVTAGITAADIAYNFANYAVIAAQSGPLAPLIAIAGGISCIIGLLSNAEKQRTIHDLIHQNIINIGNQLEQLQQSMHHRFERIETMIQQAHTQVLTQLDKMERTQLAMHEQVMQTLLQIHHQGGKLENSIKKINNELNQIRTNLEGEVKTYLTEIYDAPHQKMLNEIRTIMKSFSDPKITAKKYQEYFAAFRYQCIEASSNTIISGEAKDSDEIDEDSLARNIVKNGLDININPLLSLAKIHGVTIAAPLANPHIWAQGVADLIEFTNTMRPRFQPDQKQISVFRDIANVGQKISHFVCQVKTNRELFDDLLITKYQEALLDVKKMVTSVILRTAYPEAKDDTERMNALREYVHEQLEDQYPWHKEIVHKSKEHEDQEEKVEKLKTLLDENKKMLREKKQETEQFDSRYKDEFKTFDEENAAVARNCATSLFLTPHKATEFHHPLHAAANALVKEAMAVRGASKERNGLQRMIDDSIIPQLKAEKRQMKHRENELKRVTELADREEPIDDADIMKKYLTQIDAEHEDFNEQILEETKTPEMRAALEQLDTYFVLLNTFASLAFRKDYLQNHEMRNLFQHRLWGKSAFTGYLQQSDSKDRCIYLMLEDDLPKQIISARQLLYAKIAQAKLDQTNGVLKTDYPTIEMAQMKLEELRMLTFPTSASFLDSPEIAQEEKEVKKNSATRTRSSNSVISMSLSESTNVASREDRSKRRRIGEPGAVSEQKEALSSNVEMASPAHQASGGFLSDLSRPMIKLLSFTSFMVASKCRKRKRETEITTKTFQQKRSI